MIGPKGMASSSVADDVTLFGLTALCQRVEAKLKGGLVLPDSAKNAGETANIVEVVAIGDGRFVGRDGAWMQVAPRLKVGNLVIINPKMVEPIRLDGVTYVLVEEEHVLLVLNREMEVL